MSEKTLRTAFVACLVTAPLTASAAATQIYVQIPGVPGENPTPGYPAAISARSLEFTPGGTLTVTKAVDGASEKIQLLGFQGTTIPAIDVLVYDGAPAGAPAASLVVPDSKVSAYQPYLGPGNEPLEDDTFSSAFPGSMYLVVSGIAGESNPPGYAGAMQLQSFKLEPNVFTIRKATDSASPALLLASAQGTNIPTASILFYDEAVPNGAPDAVFNFGTLLVSAFQTDGRGDIVTFNFASVPEPACGIALLAGAGLGARRRLRISR